MSRNLTPDGQEQAQASARHRVEAAVRALGLPGTSDASYTRISAGITNLNWLVELPGQTLFVKLFGAGTDRFIDRAAVSAASRLAGELEVGPRLIAFLPDHGAEVFEYLEGYRTMAGDELHDPAVLARILAAYRRMHQAPPIEQTRTGFDQLAERVALARRLPAELPADIDALLADCAQAQAALAASEAPLALCHNDSYAANFMINDAGDVRVIDWEYAANNDPAWDLAMIGLALSGRAAAEAMVATYAGAADPALARRVFLSMPVVFVSWGLWATTQARISSIDFDYPQYSRFLLDLGRARLADPDWRAALCEA